MTKPGTTMHPIGYALALGILAGGITLTKPAHACDQTPWQSEWLPGSVNPTDYHFFWTLYHRLPADQRCGQASDQLFSSMPEWLDFKGPGDAFLVAGDLPGSSWGSRGKATPCELEFEWAKLVNAGLLVYFAPRIADFSGNDRPFHDFADYFSLIAGSESTWHDDFYTTAVESLPPPAAAQYVPSAVWEDAIVTTCVQYNGTDITKRASTLVHEAWHAWQYKHEETTVGDWFDDEWAAHHDSWNYPNMTCPLREQNPDADCDLFHSHPHSEFPAGGLQYAGRELGLTEHSTYQIEYEFLCDIAEYSPDWIPQIVREAASVQARVLAGLLFSTPPPVYCGTVRPYWTKDRAAVGTGVPQCTYSAPDPQNARDCSDTARESVDVLPFCGAGPAFDCGHTRNCPNGQICDADGCCRATCPAGQTCGSNGCCVTSCPDVAKQCTAPQWPDTFGVGYCASGQACYTPQQCCESGTPASCPQTIPGSYLMGAGGGGASEAKDSVLLYYDDATCHYRGERWEGGSATGDSVDFEKVRFPDCPLPNQTQCMQTQNPTPQFNCACGTDGCCPPVCSVDPSRQCAPGDTCPYGACQTDGCCPLPPVCTVDPSRQCTPGDTCPYGTCQTDGCCPLPPVCTADPSRQCLPGSPCTWGTCQADGCCPVGPCAADPANSCDPTHPCGSGVCNLGDNCCHASAPTDCPSLTGVTFNTSPPATGVSYVTDIVLDPERWSATTCHYEGEEHQSTGPGTTAYPMDCERTTGTGFECWSPNSGTICCDGSSCCVQTLGCPNC